MTRFARAGVASQALVRCAKTVPMPGEGLGSFSEDPGVLPKDPCVLPKGARVLPQREGAREARHCLEKHASRVEELAMAFEEFPRRSGSKSRRLGSGLGRVLRQRQRVLEVVRVLPVHDGDRHRARDPLELLGARVGHDGDRELGTPRFIVLLWCSTKVPVRPCSAPVKRSIATYPAEPFTLVPTLSIWPWLAPSSSPLKRFSIVMRPMTSALSPAGVSVTSKGPRACVV